MKRSILILGVIASASAMMFACAAKQAVGPFLLHPSPPAVEGYQLAQGSIRYADKILEAEVRPLDITWVNRQLAAAGRPSPFEGLEGGAGHPIVLEIKLRNLDTDNLYFNYDHIRGFDDEGRRYLPLGLTDFYRVLRRDPKREEKLKTLAEICFDRSAQLRPGQEAAKYVLLDVYETVPEKVIVNLPLIYSGSETMSLSFVFEAFPAKEE